MSDQQLPVVVIGSGPVGLAAAVHLIARGIEPLVLEAGAQVAAGVAGWGHVPLFSPWRFSIDAAARRLLKADGWREPDGDEHLTGAQLRERYLLPLAATPALSGRIRTGRRVVAVTRRATDKMKDADRERAPFELVVATDAGVERLLARAVIDASGTFFAHNPLGAAGVPAIGEHEAADRIAYGVPHVIADVEHYASRRVLVVGAGHSAMNALEDLSTIKDTYPATDIHWAVRREAGDEHFGGGECDGLPPRAAHEQAVQALVERGAITLHHGVRVEAIQRLHSGIVVLHDNGTIGPVDRIVASTGFRPDLAMLREVRLGLDPSVEAPIALAPLIDPNVHTCGSVRPHGERELAHPEPDFYIAGAKSYGRAPTFQLLTGYEQVRSIAAAIAGDREAAERVELVLPTTGICRVGSQATEAACFVRDVSSATTASA